MKTLYTAILVLFTVSAFGQDLYVQANDNSLDETAIAITKKYDRELALRAEQRLLFEKKVKEFLIRSNKVKAKYEGTEKLQLLTALMVEETKEMGDILTRLQMQRYKKVRQNIQPLDRVAY